MTISLVDEFFGTDDFAENARFYVTSGSGTGSVIPAIFDTSYEESNVGGMTYQNAGPRVTVRSSDVPSVVPGSLLVLRSTNYTVQTIDDDGTGISVLHLSKEAIQS